MKLQQLVQEISITQESISQVARSREVLIQNIASYVTSGDFPALTEQCLIGSFKRKTKIYPLDDVDVLLVMGSGYLHNSNWHIIDNCTYSFTDFDKDENGNISSIRILNRLRDKLSETYPKSEIQRNNEVVNVYLSTYEVGFDLMPAFFISTGNYYLIPAGSRSTRWKHTNPLVDELILNRINSNNEGRIKDVIKLAKHFFEYKRIPRLRSYHLESCAYFIFEKIAGSYKLADYLSYFFEKLTRELLLSCVDPTGYSEPLSSGLSSQAIDGILVQLSAARSMLAVSEEDYCGFVGF